MNTIPGKSAASQTVHKHTFVDGTRWPKDYKHNWEPIVIFSRFIVMVWLLMIC